MSVSNGGEFHWKLSFEGYGSFFVPRIDFPSADELLKTAVSEAKAMPGDTDYEKVLAYLARVESHPQESLFRAGMSEEALERREVYGSIPCRVGDVVSAWSGGPEGDTRSVLAGVVVTVSEYTALIRYKNEKGETKEDWYKTWNDDPYWLLATMFRHLTVDGARYAQDEQKKARLTKR